ncbi:hypothetical protein ACSBLW_06570 [Thioclava sp. FR2]|uniref:hypothetical protein n=1 Tax=Thioclava sp. FR2 TaxID=3445780 RepID=UPI003EB88E99
MKTFLVMVSLALPVQAGTLPLAPQAGEEQVYQFASCAGRFSALMEHQWLVDGPESERTARMVANMSALVQAVLAEGQGRRALSWRIEAKAAQRALLMQADFGTEAPLRQRAQARAEVLLGACRALLLG